MAKKAAATKKTGDDAKNRALQLALDQIEKNHGKGAIMRMGETTHMDVRCVSSGALSLDLALGGRGMPTGRIVEVFGPESSGKTTLALHMVAEVQKTGGTAAFIDAEHALDPTYARALGINIDDLLVSQPDSGEQALEIAELLIRSNAVDIIVVDSVAALVPRTELNGEIGDTHVGLQARLMSQALRKLTHVINKASTSLIFINQLREKIGVTFGSPETTPGGRALKFYASIRLDVRRIGQLKDNAGGSVGNRTRVKVVKNKVAPPFRQAEFDIVYGKGICRMGDVVDLAIGQKLITKSGSWYSLGDTRLGQGREAAKQYLEENPDVVTELVEKIKAEHLGATYEETVAGGDDDDTEPSED